MSSRYRRIESFQSTPFEDDLLVLNATTYQVVQMNAVAAVLWDALRWPQSVEDLRALLVEAFPSEDAGALDSQVRAVIATLLDVGLVEERQASGAGPHRARR